MVENQLRPNRIEDPRLLDAMQEIPRELFCPAQLRGVAYTDDDIDLGGGRHLIEPLGLARLCQVVQPQPGDVGLVIGCDTGYAAAVLGRLVATVFLLAPNTEAARAAEGLFGEIGCDNVVLQVGQPAEGLPTQAPFDVIVVAGSVRAVPPSLLAQLGEGGRLAAVINDGRSGKLTLHRKIGDAIGRTVPFDARLPPLAGLPQPREFVF
jgi:protein-L-isoaspartate(D-aspartate) O-methyltransferase